MKKGNRIRWIVAGSLALVAVLMASWVLYSTLFPLFVAFGLAYAVSPLVDRLEKRGLSRSLCALGLLVLIFSLVVVFVAVVVPLTLREVGALAQVLPDHLRVALERVWTYLDRFGIAVPLNRNELIEQIRERLSGQTSGSLSSVAGTAGKVMTGFLSGVGATFLTMLNFLIVPVFFFYFLKDLPSIRRTIMSLVPTAGRPKVRSIVTQIDDVLAGYIRGQMLVAGILAVAFALALWALGIPYGPVIGISAGLLNLVPYLGQIVGLCLSILMALVDFQGWARVLAIPALFGVMNFIEGNFITPRVVGNRVGLSPVWSIISLIVGGKLGGLTGLIVAIPVAGSLRVLLLELLSSYRASPWFLENDRKN